MKGRICRALVSVSNK